MNDRFEESCTLLCSHYDILIFISEFNVNVFKISPLFHPKVKRPNFHPIILVYFSKTILTFLAQISNFLLRTLFKRGRDKNNQTFEKQRIFSRNTRTFKSSFSKLLIYIISNFNFLNEFVPSNFLKFFHIYVL